MCIYSQNILPTVAWDILLYNKWKKNWVSQRFFKALHRKLLMWKIWQQNVDYSFWIPETLWIIYSLFHPLCTTDVKKTNPTTVTPRRKWWRSGFSFPLDTPQHDLEMMVKNSSKDLVLFFSSDTFIFHSMNFPASFYCVC